MKVYDKLDEIGKPDGLYPVYLDIHGGGFANSIHSIIFIASDVNMIIE